MLIPTHSKFQNLQRKVRACFRSPSRQHHPHSADPFHSRKFATETIIDTQRKCNIEYSPQRFFNQEETPKTKVTFGIGNTYIKQAQQLESKAENQTNNRTQYEMLCPRGGREEVRSTLPLFVSFDNFEHNKYINNLIYTRK